MKNSEGTRQNTPVPSEEGVPIGNIKVGIATV